MTFSEVVLGVDATDLLLGGTAAGLAFVGTPVNTTGNTWRFPVAGLVNGTLDLSLAPDAGDIEDVDGNDLANLTWSYVAGGENARVESFETGDFSRFPWQHSGNGNWTIGTTTSVSGDYERRCRRHRPQPDEHARCGDGHGGWQHQLLPQGLLREQFRLSSLLC